MMNSTLAVLMSVLTKYNFIIEHRFPGNKYWDFDLGKVEILGQKYYLKQF